jgi:large subunit ribosomal protein L6
MSKIGQTPVTVAPSVTVTIESGTVAVVGKEGKLSYEIPAHITLKNENGVLTVIRTREDKKTRSMHGLFRKLIANAVTGVEKPWTKQLEIVGTGFNVKMQGEEFILKLGFSHQVTVKKVEGVKFAIDGNTKMSVSGIDRQLVGQVAHQIKIIKKPDAYKGKGIRYAGEFIKTKPGKKAKAA